MSRRNKRFAALLGLILASPIVNAQSCGDAGVRQLILWLDPCSTIFTCTDEFDIFNFVFNPAFFGEFGSDYGIDPFCSQPGGCGVVTFDRFDGVSDTVAGGGGGATGGTTGGTTGGGATGPGGPEGF